MKYVIGVDGGTESLRAMVFDLTGAVQSSVATPYPTDYPQPSWAEQDPMQWWQALGESVRGAVKSAGIDGQDVQAICLDTTSCSVVALNDKGEPLRPAMIWMDVRAAEQANEVAATGDAALRINSGGNGPVSAEWMIPKALWLKQNQAALYEQASRIGEYQDFLNFHLTGVWTGSLNNATMRWHYQTEHGGFPDSLLQKLGLEDLLSKWPDKIIAPGQVIEGLTDSAAKHLDLPAGMPVVQGGADAFIGMVGLGVAQPGEMALITGSSHLQLGVTANPVHGNGIWGTYLDCVYPGRSIIEGGQTSTGSVIAWFKRHFAPNTSFDELNAQASAISPGAEGLLILEHFQGNRTPFTDPLSRGAVTGLTLKHTPAHLYRAIIESICYGTRLIMENFGDSFAARRIVAAGGALQSDLWMQLHADTLGLPLEITEVPVAPALGCAVLAAHGAGCYATIDEAIDAMVRVTHSVEPIAANSGHYDELFPAYSQLYHALRSMRSDP